MNLLIDMFLTMVSTIDETMIIMTFKGTIG